MNTQANITTAPPSFAMTLMHRVIAALDDFHPGNAEPRRLLPPTSETGPDPAQRQAHLSAGYTHIRSAKRRALWCTEQFAPHMGAFERCYAALADAPSRRAMVDHLAYLMLGPDHVRLPPPTPDYAATLDRLDAIAAPVPGLTDPSLPPNQTLHAYDLADWSLPIRAIGRSLGVYNIFLVPQYAYSGAAVHVGPRPGYTVLDLGGSYGDSALYFAHAAGPTGRVFTWEFLPSSLTIMQRQLAENPALATCIEQVQRPAWHRTGDPVWFRDAGPATRVSATQTPETPDQVDTLCIDDFAQDNRLAVDFIKMDIEGAELLALRGAEQTLRRDRPRLALSAYHRLDDLALIPEYLLSLDLGYRLHLRSTTIFGAELVLFADCP